VTQALVAGIAAGLAIAVPVGAIGILIVETGLGRGFGPAFAAGAGTASADGIYASVAVLAGVALADVIAPWARPLRFVAVAVLVAIGVRGLVGAFGALRRPAVAAERVEVPAERVEVPAGGAEAVSALPDAGGMEAVEPVAGRTRTYLTFLGLTLLNPMTVIYFASLILGLGTGGSTPAEKAAFVGGAFAASLAWQSVLAGAGALLHRRLGPRLRVAVSLLGNAIILVFAATIARDLLA
jgi:arginine exporter protein ArgO